MSRTILLAVDHEANVARAADMAADLAGRPGDQVVVLHVHEYAVGRFGRVQVDCADGEGERVVGQIAERLRAAGVEAREEIRSAHVGHVPRTILDIAEEADARMIVLGSATARDVPWLPFGGVSLRLLHLSDRPVLIVPRARRAAEAATAESAASAATSGTAS